MASREITVNVTGLDTVRQALDDMKQHIDWLETAVRNPYCSQCGKHWDEPACGPTHACIGHVVTEARNR